VLDLIRHIHFQDIEGWSCSDCSSPYFQIAGDVTDMRPASIFCLLCGSMQVLFPGFEEPALESWSGDFEYTGPESVATVTRCLKGL
jgi:hypothetical protein